MTFKGRIVSVGDNPLYGNPTVTLELENGQSLEIVITKPLAVQFGQNLFNVVEVDLKDPFVLWPPQVELPGITNSKIK